MVVGADQVGVTYLRAPRAVVISILLYNRGCIFTANSELQEGSWETIAKLGERPLQDDSGCTVSVSPSTLGIRDHQHLSERITGGYPKKGQ